MRSVQQLFRQPLKMIAGFILIVLGVAILVTCVGQYAATSVTRANLNDGYDTIALLSDEYFWVKTANGRYHYSDLPDDIQAWVDDTKQNRTDLIQGESFTELYSAYIPGVSPDSFSKHENGDNMDFYNPTVGIGNPYRCAMLEVTMTTVGTLIEEKTVQYGTSMEDMRDYREYILVLCIGTVERVIGLEQGFESPVGETIAFTIKVYGEDELDAMELEVGNRYLVYGMDYSDVKGDALYSRILTNPNLYEELFGPAEMGLNGPEYYPIVEQIDCYMSVCDYANLPTIYRTNGGFELRQDLRQYSYRDENGTQSTFIPAEEYVPRYRVPTITKLDGTAESYLESENGALWRQALEEMEINNHGFPVLAVDKLGYQVAFARGESRIVEGRDFTEMERMEGARVCIISESLATQNGLMVGDTIKMRTYAYDPNIEVQKPDLLNGTRFPSAAVYSRSLGFTSEQDAYTIVGIYRQSNAWKNREDAYGFTPNTIFVPKGSILGDVRMGTQGIFYSMVLRNGKMNDFQVLQEDAGYPNLFICLDQGYTEIADGLDAYEGVSFNALKIGIAGCIVIMMLFLILFPAQHGKTLATMTSLGTPRGKCIWHIIISTLCLLIPGVAIGGMVGSLLWERVAATLMESVNVQIPLEANIYVLVLGLTICVFAMMMVATLLLAAMVTGNKGLMRRK